MLAYLFAQCSHAVGEFSLPAIAASLLSFLSFLSKFREISWGEVFSRKEERGDDDDETKYSSSPNELFFSAAKFFFVGRNFWREERTRQIFFSFLSLIAEGWVSNGRENERRVFRNREGDILLFFSLLPRIVFWDNVSRWETNFRMSNGHEKKDFSTTWTWKEDWKVLNTLEETFASFATIIIALILISYPRFGRIWNEDCEWINNGTRMKAWNPRVFCDK